MDTCIKEECDVGRIPGLVKELISLAVESNYDLDNLEAKLGYVLREGDDSADAECPAECHAGREDIEHWKLSHQLEYLFDKMILHKKELDSIQNRLEF